MLVFTMTIKEMYDHLAYDKKKVDLKKDYLLPHAIKSLKRKNKFPAYEIYDYTIPSTKNKYIICFSAQNRMNIANPQVTSFVKVSFGGEWYRLQWGAGGYKHTENSPIIALRQIHVCTTHFLKRYNERFLKKESLSNDEIACIFFTRNKDFMPLKVNDKINRNHERYGISGQEAFRVRDGFCFLQVALQGEESPDHVRKHDKIDAMGIIYKTFMNESGMQQEQRDAIQEEHIDKWLHAIEDFGKQADADGHLTLTLEK